MSRGRQPVPIRVILFGVPDGGDSRSAGFAGFVAADANGAWIQADRNCPPEVRHAVFERVDLERVPSGQRTSARLIAALGESAAMLRERGFVTSGPHVAPSWQSVPMPAPSTDPGPARRLEDAVRALAGTELEA